MFLMKIENLVVLSLFLGSDVKNLDVAMTLQNQFATIALRMVRFNYIYSSLIQNTYNNCTKTIVVG